MRSGSKLLAASSLAVLACAADPGDPLKTSAAYSGSSGAGSGIADASSNGSSGSSGVSGSSSGSSGGSSTGSSTGSSGGNSGGSTDASGEGSSGIGDSAIVDATADTGPILPEGGASCVTSTCPLKVQWRTPMTGQNTIGPDVNVINTGLSAVDLANVKIHYYYTADGDTSPVFECDYAGYYNSGMTGLSKANVMGTFVLLGANATSYADTFLEISFSSASLPPGTTASINFRIHNANYSVNYNQANDWSALSPMNPMNYVDAPYITAYLNDALAWGIEPGTLPADAGTPPDAALSDGSASDVSAN